MQEGVRGAGPNFEYLSAIKVSVKDKSRFQNRSISPQILSDLSSVFGKKMGNFNKKESESLDFTGLKIPRDHIKRMEGTKSKKRRDARASLSNQYMV